MDRIDLPGGAYTTEWMMQAVVDRIGDKEIKYENVDFRALHVLQEFDLVCYYCDEAMLHNTPIHGIEYGFPELAGQVKQIIRDSESVFDRIFLFHPHETPYAIQVY